MTLRKLLPVSLLTLLLLSLTLTTGAQQQPNPTPVLVCAYNSPCPPFGVVTATPLPSQQSTSTNTLPAPTNTPTPRPSPLPTSTIQATIVITLSPTTLPPSSNPLTQTGALNSAPTTQSFASTPDLGVQTYYVRSVDQISYQNSGIEFARIDVHDSLSADNREVINSLQRKYALISMDRSGSPDTEQYATNFYNVMFQLNVVEGKAYTVAEVDNEPDFATNPTVLPVTYASAFKRVYNKLHASNDPRLTNIILIGPTLGSGDPLDGGTCQQGGYANKTSNRDHWREYIPELFKLNLTNPGAVTTISWHDYGEPGVPDGSGEHPWGQIRLDQLTNTCEVMLRALGLAPSLKTFISEFNFDAGPISPRSLILYHNFFNSLWHASVQNHYAMAGNVVAYSLFAWEGDKGLVMNFSSNQPSTLLPVYYETQLYSLTMLDRTVAYLPGTINPWADTLVTTDEAGTSLGIISVNKSPLQQTLDLTFDYPPTISGDYTLTVQTMTAGGSGQYGSKDAKPNLTKTTYDLTINPTNKLRYFATLQPESITFYSLVKKGA